MNSLDNLTPEEKVVLAKVLGRVHAENAPIEMAMTPPSAGTCLGRVGRFVVYLYGVGAGVALFLKVLLIPADSARAIEYYSPVISVCRKASVAAVHKLDGVTTYLANTLPVGPYPTHPAQYNEFTGIPSPSGFSPTQIVSSTVQQTTTTPNSQGFSLLGGWGDT